MTEKRNMKQELSMRVFGDDLSMTRSQWSDLLDACKPTSELATTKVLVDDLRGAEQTPFGEVAYIICEDDGIDVVFTGEDGCFHFDYGTMIEVKS